jgi:hypothetical protein
MSWRTAQVSEPTLQSTMANMLVLVMLRMKLNSLLIMQHKMMQMNWEMKFWESLPVQIIEPLLCRVF